MKATDFSARRLPKVGDTVIDLIRETPVIVTKVESRLILVRAKGDTGSYGRMPRLFKF